MLFPAVSWWEHYELRHKTQFQIPSLYLDAESGFKSLLCHRTALSIDWGPFYDGFFCLSKPAPCGGGWSHQGPICHQTWMSCPFLMCWNSCHWAAMPLQTFCSAAYTLLISRCSFSSNYFSTAVTPKHLGALLCSNNCDTCGRNQGWYVAHEESSRRSTERGFCLVQCIKLLWVCLNADWLAEELSSEDKWFGSWVLGSVRSPSGRAILTSWASGLFLYLFWFTFYWEVFETKWRLQTGVESSPWSGCGYVGMSQSGQDGPNLFNLLWVLCHRPLSHTVRSLVSPCYAEVVKWKAEWAASLHDTVAWGRVSG